MHKGLKRALGAMLIAVTLYSLLGFLIIPGIALRVINQQLSQLSTVPARLERVQLNPFSLELSLWGLHLGEADKAQLGFAQLYADLQLDSLWSGALHLAKIELNGAKVELLFSKDGQLNLAQLFKLPERPATPEPAEPSEPFPLRIERIVLAAGAVHFEDLRPSEPIEFVYDSLDLSLSNLSTLPDDNAELSLQATGPNGGKVEWQGTLSLSPISSSGHLQLSDGKLKGIWPYVRDALPLDLQEGILNLATDYQLSLGGGTQLQLSNLSLALAPFAIKAPDGRPLVKLAELNVSDTSLDLVKQQVVVGKIRSQGLETWAAREADGQLDWQTLFAKPEAPAPAASQTADAGANNANSEPAKPWQVLLKDVQLRGYQLHLADRGVSPEVKVEVGPLNLDLQNFDSLNQSPFDLKLDTGVGKLGKLALSGQVNLNPVSAKLQASTQNLDLRLAQAYINPFIRLELRSGLLSSELAVDLQSTAPLAFNISGDTRINQLHTLDTLKSRDFLKWRQLHLQGLDYRHGDSLAIKAITLEQPYTRFIINEDRSTNVSDLLIPQPAAPASPAAAKSAPDKPLGIVIGGITLKDGSANFADLSLRPDFATAIQQLNGQIGRIDSRQPKPAKVAIQGKVDRYAPATINGSLNPFDPLASLDMAVSFKQVELTTLTPYSGKFAGYRIRKGRLNIDLHYQIKQGQLTAENKVLLEQLELGEQVDSPDAVDLPIRLAIALLKDTEGKIDIQLPISGDLNNPQFSVMPIVWQTLRNLVLRAAQAPFKFIGGLVSGGDEVNMDRVPFSAGSSELDPQARGTLDTLASALKERPVLRLEVQGVSAQASDGPLLAEQRLQREYQSTYYKILQRRGDQVPADASSLDVPEDEKMVMLEGIYRARLKQQPPADWRELDDELRADKLRADVLDSWARSDLLLRQLSQARAASIKQYLVDNGGLPDQRIYLLDVAIGQSDTDGRIASALQLGTE
ncbi:MAG TPA: DUF748 domain-containing protein [Pseudomonas sp.]|uniref:DUF748 domain-containing protein n=1 Tax=Pseudomonas sp. TaxID=306 RepID=UPI002CA1939C|nr:DUF748 domain-containing protein [Pseudomonas sp.]HRL94052.1 DUF748 domain-containing protein [Pseudomonas sp.]